MNYNNLNANDLAEHVIFLASEENIQLNNLKLQKILYFIQAIFLVKFNKSAFNDKIEAWTYGAVVPSVYKKFRYFGSMNIHPSFGKDHNLRRDENKAIVDFLEETKDLSAYELVEIINKQDPWLNVYKKGCNNEILTKDIKYFFSK